MKSRRYDPCDALYSLKHNRFAWLLFREAVLCMSLALNAQSGLSLSVMWPTAWAPSNTFCPCCHACQCMSMLGPAKWPPLGSSGGQISFIYQLTVTNNVNMPKIWIICSSIGKSLLCRTLNYFRVSVKMLILHEWELFFFLMSVHIEQKSWLHWPESPVPRCVGSRRWPLRWEQRSAPPPLPPCRRCWRSGRRCRSRHAGRSAASPQRCWAWRPPLWAPRLRPQTAWCCGSYTAGCRRRSGRCSSIGSPRCPWCWRWSRWHSAPWGSRWPGEENRRGVIRGVAGTTEWKQPVTDGGLPCTVCRPVPTGHGRGRKEPGGMDRRPPQGPQTPDSPQRHYLRGGGREAVVLKYHFACNTCQ